MRVGLLPVGPVPPRLLDELSRSLVAYHLELHTLSQEAIPDEVFDPRRRKHRAEGFLRRQWGNADETFLAVTTVDLFTEGLDFVFGLADVSGGRAVVSVRRLADSDPDVVSARLLKECVHELGHTWGHQHCDDSACVMHFSNSIEETDAKSARFCETCARSLPEGIASPPDP